MLIFKTINATSATLSRIVVILALRQNREYSTGNWRNAKRLVMQDIGRYTPQYMLILLIITVSIVVFLVVFKFICLCFWRSFSIFNNSHLDLGWGRYSPPQLLGACAPASPPVYAYVTCHLYADPTALGLCALCNFMYVSIHALYEMHA